MEIKIIFDSQEKISAYEYGDIIISGNKGCISSKNLGCGEVMIFPSIQSFFDDIIPLLHNRHEFIYFFQGIDTPGFNICFQCKKGTVTVSYYSQIIDVISSEQFYKDLCHTLTAICMEYLDKMDDADHNICKEILSNVRKNSFLSVKKKR